MKRGHLDVLLAGWMLLFGTACSHLATPPRIELTDAFPTLPAFKEPVDLKHAGDGSGRLYIVEKAGLILAFDNDRRVSRVDTVLDLRDQVLDRHIEEGLLGLAFHPDYTENGRFFVYYTIDNPFQSMLAEFTRSAGSLKADPTTQRVLLEVPQPGTGHYGGALAFGPDGYLYLGVGDGACCSDASNAGQDRTSLLASLLRLDVDTPSDGLPYGIPPDNPFVGNDAGFREEIYAYGFRNPWRFSFDAQTGELWLGDVGEGVLEEINLVRSGGNYGWSIAEATRCFRPVEDCDRTGLVDPVWKYYQDPHQAVVGGYVYRGSAVPSLVGQYIYGDFGTGQLWTLTYYPATRSAVSQELDVVPSTISSFGVDEQNELYIVSFGEGRVFHFGGKTEAALEAPPAARNVRFDIAGPNPFRGETGFVVEVEQAGLVRVAVYDVLGREVAVLYEGVVRQGGPQHVVFDAHTLPAGVYYCKMEAGRHVQVRSVVLTE